MTTLPKQVSRPRSPLTGLYYAVRISLIVWAVVAVAVIALMCRGWL